MEAENFNDLLLFWTKFNEVEDSLLKEKWLELFLFTFNQLSVTTNYDHLYKHCSLSSSVASKLTGYTLQHVYGIICASLTEIKNDEHCSDITEENSHRSHGQDGCVIKSQPNDITTIIALREFLTHGIGGRILESFQIFDTKKIICARELTSLLVNLFPTHPWEFFHPEFSTKDEVDDSKPLHAVLERIENLKLPKRSSERRSTKDSIFSDSSKIQYSISVSEEELYHDGSDKQPELYHSREFIEWKSTNFSCDYIASIILNLLGKLAAEENMLSIDKKSVSVQSLNFSVDCYCSIVRNEAFKFENKEKLRCKALTLVFMCLYNILANTKRFEEHIDILAIFEKLYDSFTSNGDHCMTPIQLEHETGLIYASCLILHKLRKHQSMIGLNLFKILNTRFDCILNVVKSYYQYTPNENCENLSKLIHVLCKTIFDIRNHDPGLVKLKKTKRNPRKKITKYYLCTHHHENTSECGCVLENLLLEIMQYASMENLITSFQFFQRNTVCCCNINLKVIEQIITNAKSKRIHKAALNFMKNNFLKTFYSNIECGVCDAKKSAINFENEFVALYKKWFQQLQSTDMITFLSHIAKISKYLSFEVSFQFFVDIVLPPFRVEKVRYLESAKTAAGQEIMESCLNIFLCFLKDVRLIKGFFNSENVQHIEDLIVFPEFASLTCCLLKIGMENLSFLGENSIEQLIMSEKLNKLQSNAISNIWTNLIFAFRQIDGDRNIGLKFSERCKQMTLDTSQSTNSSLKDILHLGVVYWNLILQLLRTNAQFRNVIRETIVKEPCDLQHLVFNSFSCYLNSKQSSGGSCSKNLNEVLIKKIEEWLLENHCNYVNIDGQSNTDVNINSDCDLNVCDYLLMSDKQSGIFDIQYDVDYTKIMRFYYINGSTFDYRNLKSFKNDNSFIANGIFNNCDSLDYIDDQLKTPESEYLIISSVKKIKKFFTDTLLDHFFVSSSIETTKLESKSETDYSIYAKNYDSAECNSLFLQLFEITAGVMILANFEQTNSVSAIRELKCLLLKYSSTTTGLAEEGSKLIGALQSLLKVAEMKYQCCFITNCSHSVPSTNLAQQNIVSTNENSDAYCCSASNRLNDDDIFSSDIEGSGEETTSEDIYTTADEGYDGDAEVMPDNGLCEEINANQLQASRYRNHVIHEGLCRVVIDILIDLSKRCLKDPLFWPKYLIQIATRLGTIRESIGGSLYLIRGFAKILARNDLRLKELQKSILELITDINTPETLSAYLNILSGDNPPVDLLLPRLVYLGSFSYRIQPSTALQFPSINDESVNRTCDPLMFKDIKQIHDYHEFHKLKTAFTQSTYIMPLNNLNFSPWNQSGFTVTTWIQIMSNNSQQESISETITDYEDPFQEITRVKFLKTDAKNHKMHLISVGSNKLLFSIYISANDMSTFYLQLSKPNAHHSEKKATKLTRSSTEILPNQIPNRKKDLCACSSLQRRRKPLKPISPIHQEVVTKQQKEENAKHGNIKVAEETQGLNVLSSTYNAVRSTHIAIRNSLSQFTIFSQSNDEYFSSQLPLEVKGLKLSKNKWTHLSFSVRNTGTEISVRITINGSIQRDVNIPCSQSVKNDKFQILSVGDKLTPTKIVEYINNDVQDPQQPDVMYSLSNVKLFRKCVLDSDVLASLVALGPDCVSLTECQIGNAVPNFGLSVASSVSAESNFAQSIKYLRDNLISVFSSNNTNVMTGFSQMDTNHLNGEAIGMITFGCGADCVPIPSFQTATSLCGGMSTLLFLFAKVVEVSSSEFIQSLALTFLLKIAYASSSLYTEFIQKDFISLIGPIIRSTRCIKGINLLNSILETACDKPLLSRRAKEFYVVSNTNANILHANLIISIINRYSDWYVPKCNESNIIAMLLETVQALVREKHPRQIQNIQCLTKVGLIPALLNFCKIYLVGVPEPVYLSCQAAESIVNLIGIFAGSPPSSLLLDDIIKILLLLHRPSETFVTHDRSNFYFLLSSMVMIKPKRMSLPMSARKLSQSIRRERKNAIPIRNFKLPSTQSSSMQRSISLDHSMYNRQHQSSVSSESRSGTKEMEGAAKDESEIQPSEYPYGNGSLDAIVNYSNTDRRMKRFLNPGETSNALLNVKLRKRTINKRKVSRKSRSNISPKSRTTTDSETDRETRNKGSVSESGIEEDIALKEYEIIVSEDIRKIEETVNFKVHQKDSPFQNTQHGIVQLQNGFFNLLRDFILILPDASIQEVLTHYVTVDIILIMANHQDSGVRTSIVKLLAIICSRLNETIYNSSIKLLHWYHLGNQIALHTADLNLVTSIVQWVTLSYLTIDQLIAENCIRIAEKCGMNSLIAILPQCIHDLNLTKSIFTFMDKLYKKESTNQRRFMIEIGILPSVMKSLANFYSIWGTSNDRILNSIQDLMTTIAYQSLSSNGNISVVWDLFNGLTFLEENKNLMIQRSIRSTQAVILNRLLESFFPVDRPPSSAKFKFNASDVNLSDCLLSLSEKKIRFELLINRIVQFITCMESSYIQTDQEIKLIENVAILSISGCSHGNNIIGWGLCPSRPLPLKMFIIKTLWKYSRFGILPSLACDGKIIKTMAHKFMITDKDILSSEDSEILINVCKSMGISASTASNLSQTLEKMEFMRNSSIKDQNPSIERTVFKFEPLVSQCVDSAMKITRDIIGLQNSERRILMNKMREYDESGLSQEWNIIIDRMTHEGAPWCNQESYPSSWEMDQTEGPFRTRIRLRRCHLNIDRKFLISDMKDEQSNRSPPLSYLRKSLVQRPHFSLSDQVIHTFPCKYLPVDDEVDGEIVITESNIIFLANNLDEDPINIDVAHVSEIWLRRYQHQEIGLEFFLESNNSKFFIFADPKDRKIIEDYFADKVVECLDPEKLEKITHQWKERHITNWEYLMTLNQISGRTFQDLMQYPVFPWILADYKSSSLDLTNSKTFRNLEKPIAVQHQENEAHYISNYNYLEQTRMASSGVGCSQLVPYHYGSHYSNSGTVLHFMVRVPPFTQFFLHYQDNNFDLPDRTFHAVNTTWRLASKESPTDVKELIPEFFCFPEMFENFEGLNFGVRQSGESVYNVILPTWANQSSRFFILIHRQALECDLVRQNLHKWIDLVFGYKQVGQEAINAINVFHPATYIGFSASGSDPVEKIALETMVRTYGQMPRQLMTKPHPNSSSPSIARSTTNLSINLPVKGLRWGNFTGSPELSEPKLCHFYQQFDLKFSSLVPLINTNVLYGLPRGCNIMQCHDTMNLISWNEGDGIIRIRPLCDENSMPKPLIRDCSFDRISCCGTDPQSNQLWLGHKSGRISVYQCVSTSHSKVNKNRALNSSVHKLSYNSAFRKISTKDIDHSSESQNMTSYKWKDVVTLIKHTNEVMQICISNEFKIVVTVAKDGLAAIWDLNKLNFVRSIERPSICQAPIYLAAISPTLGDIVTIHILDSNTQFSSNENLSSMNECLEVTEYVDDDFVNVSMEIDGKSLMRLHTINAKYISHISISDKVKCVCYSYIKEGTGINVIATGFDGGLVRLWSSWDLSLVKEINVGNMHVVSLCYSTYQHLVVLTSDNLIQIWESIGLPGIMPKFPQLIFHKSKSF